MNSLSTNTNRNVEALRGLAALVVAYFHCRVIAWIGIQQYAQTHHFAFSLDSLLAYATIPFGWGAIGVPVFFVISGYCIHRGPASRLRRTPQYTLYTWDFLRRRFVRIYPILLAALILTFVLDNASLRFFPHNDRLGDLGLATFAANLFALQGIFSPSYGSNGALWTLAIEIQFYAMYPLLFPVIRRLGATPTLLALAFVSIASYMLFERRGVVVFTSYWFSWYLGAYVAQLQIAGARPAPRAVCAAAIGLLAAGCVVSFRSEYLAFQLWSLAFAPVLLSVCQVPDARSRLMRLLAKIGDFSYSLYIVHVPIFVFLVSWLFHSRKPDSILYSACFLCVAVAGAYLFYWCVERPVLRWLKTMSSRRTLVNASLSLKAADK